jgi:hypothetical protein
MASLRWSYDRNAHRYRDGNTGRFLTNQTIIDLRDGLLDSRVSATKSLSEALADGRIDLPGWQSGMRAVSKDTAVAEYLFGRGGINAMTQADYGRVGALVKEQYQFLQGFAQDISDGKLSEKQIEARAAMYAHAGVTAHSVGQEAAYGGRLNLPAHPGSAECLTRCRCHWSIQEGPEAWVCTWVRTSGESCATCISRASTWNPFVQSKVNLRVVA